MGKLALKIYKALYGQVQNLPDLGLKTEDCLNC